ncbi:hypothetical protein UFOVP1506_7 [uncultured Caudovirales phage]|uniref:Uncharacterized protein n=1 Tax=uncultured Caudovirales phage TaxID=2100421 RepID=A0A6J5LQX5_9CAUD|nr:hypothetical protein UFOVP292_7 [uncultured Caudovirales phage]CAB4149554.1 hypothetical protein UFOVP559_21 [uncultured Caudovirales phage]CAB4180103.1 hypothetical protein UFOVP1055_6 [uncultured Caudovirales phage]CAB4194854.1 hypothetical protein UFOVP1270_6 [uncultured Caudovirales phage]CAB4203758.1 hypothetical protein UFOVP1397_6 [uncultured Caudovirales phage]
MDLSNYVDVPERFKQALAKWPELRVMENRPEIITIGDKTFISVTMQIWRTPDDPIPAQATCFEPFPGKTSFTRDSEQMNASTSCLGRCLGLMMSFGSKMASTEEVRNRQETSAPANLVRQPQNARTQALGANASNAPSEAQLKYLRGLNYEGPAPETRAECTALIKRLAP